MIRSLATFKAGKDKEIFRDGVLYAGQTAAIVYKAKAMPADLFAVQLATALTVGKPFGGFIPRDPIKAGVVVTQRSDKEIDRLRDEIGDYWKSVGWSADEIDNAMRQTLIIDRKGNTGEDLAKYLRDAQPQKHFDLLIISDLVWCYGDDPEIQSGETFAKFLHSLGTIQSGEKPCAILALVGVEDNEGKIRDYFHDSLVSAHTSKKWELAFPQPKSPIIRAVFRWARCFFGLYEIEGTLSLVAARHGGQLPWRTIHGECTRSHALRLARGHLEDLQIKSVRGEERRRDIENCYSCADTLEAELDHLKTSKE